LSKTNAYLLGTDFSIADIAFYNELVNTIEIIGMNIEGKKYPNVDKWMKKLEDIGHIREYTFKFLDHLKEIKEMLLLK
jgi:glutathione S-transferase